jgi:hypothetical protein
MNNKINKSNKNSVKRKRRYNKGKNRKSFKTYNYRIRTALVNYITPTYTEQNLNFQIYYLLRSTEVFQHLAKGYQQFKLDRVTFIGIPRVVNGTDPSPLWIYLDTSGEDTFNYSVMPELQGSKSIPVKHKSYTKFSNTGRQNDFHYWYDVNGSNTINGDVSIRVHSESIPNSSRFWQFQIEFSVKFRGLIVQLAESKNSGMKVSGMKVEIPKNSDGDLAEEEVKESDSLIAESEISTTINN